MRIAEDPPSAVNVHDDGKRTLEARGPNDAYGHVAVGAAINVDPGLFERELLDAGVRLDVVDDLAALVDRQLKQERG